MNYSPQRLHERLDGALSELSRSRHFLVGLSGGLDSVVLLHALAQLRAQSDTTMQLRAIHINHQLQEQAESWAQHCATLCDSLGVEFLNMKVRVSVGSGVENAARDARYREFEAVLSGGEELLLAHHRDDQMETLLLRLIRGSGSRGLSGIPSSRELGRGRVVRPLLGIDRAELQRYAEAAQLSWVEDGSNLDETFDRNYCRHSLLPLIEERWPGYRESWSKTAVLARESESLMRELAAIDLAEIATSSMSVVHRNTLLALSTPRRRNVLRYWLASLGVAELGWNQLHQLSDEVLESSSGQCLMGGCAIHCYREGVHALSLKALRLDMESGSSAEVSGLASILIPSSAEVFANEIDLPNNGRLRFNEAQGEGLAMDKLSSLSIRYRQGGEACRLQGHPNKTLKKILQEVEIQPWLRSRIPLLYNGDELAYIPGIGVSEEYTAKTGEAGCLIDWQQPDLSFH